MHSIKKNLIRDVTFGKNCKIVEPVNLYECEISDDVFIGPFVEITKGVKIGKGTRISSHSFVCELVTIGDKCFIGHGVMFTNDLFKNGKLGTKLVRKELENHGLEFSRAFPKHFRALFITLRISERFQMLELFCNFQIRLLNFRSKVTLKLSM